MTQHQIEELLSQQADRLAAGSSRPAGIERSGQERAAELASVERAGLTRDEQRLLGGLMGLARRVQAELVEVEPRQAFVADLKARLIAKRQAMMPAAAGRGKLWVWGVAGLAGALSLAGLGFWGYRAVRARAALPKP
jgi:hypothetical protein